MTNSSSRTGHGSRDHYQHLAIFLIIFPHMPEKTFPTLAQISLFLHIFLLNSKDNIFPHEISQYAWKLTFSCSFPTFPKIPFSSISFSPHSWNTLFPSCFLVYIPKINFPYYSFPALSTSRSLKAIYFSTVKSHYICLHLDKQQPIAVENGLRLLGVKVRFFMFFFPTWLKWAISFTLFFPLQ